MANKFLDDAGLSQVASWVKLSFVAKEEGKGLSSNDYTTTEKNKLAGIAEGANNYTLPVASTNTLGGVKLGENLNIDENGAMSVSTATEMLENSTKPITSGAVYKELGNVEALLKAL